MRFLSALVSALMLSSASAASLSLTQLLASSHIVDLTMMDSNTNTQMAAWREYQQVTTDSNNMQTWIVSKVATSAPFNETITYEQAQLSGTGGSAQDGPIATYNATSTAPSMTGARTWNSCSYSTIASRQPNYCTEMVETPTKTYPCGQAMDRTCTRSQVACRVNNVIMPAKYYMIDSTSGDVVSQMDSTDSTQVTYWSNLVSNPTSGQFGDATLLPAKGSCPDNNEHFPATFGTAPNTQSSNTSPTSTPGSTTGRTGSTGINVYNAATATTGLSFIAMLLPAALAALILV